MTEKRIESPELRDYRLRARAWLADNVERVDGHTPERHDDPRVEKDLQQRIHEAGYAGFTFPMEYGGQGLTLGAHEQKLAHVPNILSGRVLWLQFLSESSGGVPVPLGRHG